MKRTWVFVLLLLMMGGAAVNVAVAWGLASLPNAGVFGEPVDDAEIGHEDGSKIIGMVLRKIGTSYVAIVYLQGPPREYWENVEAFIHRQPPFARRHVVRWFGGNDALTPRSRYLAVIARGWPLHSLCSIEEIGFNQQSGRRDGITDEGAIVIPMNSRPNTGFAPFYAIALPCLPIWPGFAINTIFYAMILWGLFATPGMIRRRWRVRRGKCPACGYPVGTSAVCTECGGFVKAESTKHKTQSTKHKAQSTKLTADC